VILLPDHFLGANTFAKFLNMKTRKSLHFTFSPQCENWKDTTFQDFLEFLKGSFVLNVERLMEPITVSRFEVQIRTVTVKNCLQQNYVHTVLD
jgi:hypothetical protein